ncbi:MAG: SRPBCC domain-containing protein [Gemmatimonadetes bacterium]|nr:SRPBCC domain-containing protein [Gemmatimonadota bacterium]
MPTNKDFKRLVRARMRKTGEAYTAARVSLLKKRAAEAGEAAEAAERLATSPAAATLAVRSATPNKYIHITWEDGTSVDAGFTSKARSKAQVAVQHRKLQSKEAANRMKQYWTERLDALAEMLAPGGNGKS